MSAETSDALKFMYSCQYCDAVERGDSGQLWLDELRKMGVETVDCDAVNARRYAPTLNQRIALRLAPSRGWNVIILKHRYWMSSRQEWVYEYHLPEDGEPQALPDWEGSCDDALALVADDVGFELRRSAVDEWHVTYRDCYFATDRDPARAICKVWLDANEGRAASVDEG